MRTEVLTPQAQAIFPQLSHFRDDFYLAGGTGLALQIGHRVSVDFDLFSPLPIKKTLLKKVEEVFSVVSQQILVNNSSELTMRIDGVKCTFLHYPFPLLMPLHEGNPLPLLSVKECIITKAYTIGRRGEFKDYIDMYIGLNDNHIHLAEVLDGASKKYGGAFNDRLFLEQLLYFDDVESVEIVLLGGGATPSKSVLLEYFNTVVAESAIVMGKPQ